MCSLTVLLLSAPLIASAAYANTVYTSGGSYSYNAGASSGTGSRYAYVETRNNSASIFSLVDAKASMNGGTIFYNQGRYTAAGKAQVGISYVDLRAGARNSAGNWHWTYVRK